LDAGQRIFTRCIWATMRRVLKGMGGTDATCENRKERSMTAFRTAVSATLALAVTAGCAGAFPVIGLVDGNKLIRFDSENPAEVETMDVTGAEMLVGIDYRPGSQTLVGLTGDNKIVTIDPMTGAATELSTMDTPLPLGDTPVIVDFNPMADRLRLMTGTTNHRVNVDTGEVTVDGPLAFDAGDMHAGETPMIAAAAYTNSYGKPEKTAMYDIDTVIGALIQQTSPNDGTLAAVGKLGIAERYHTRLRYSDDRRRHQHRMADRQRRDPHCQSGDGRGNRRPPP
jgi:hypothetical protein